MTSVTAFRPYRGRRKVKLEPLSHVIAQMQGVLDSEENPEDQTEIAFRVLVSQWHGLLQAALVDEAKH